MNIIVNGARLEAIPDLKDLIVKTIRTLLNDPKGPLHSLGIPLGYLPAVKANFQMAQCAGHLWPILLDQLLAQAIQNDFHQLVMVRQSAIALHIRDVLIVIAFDEEETRIANNLQRDQPIQMTRDYRGPAHLDSISAMTP